MSSLFTAHAVREVRDAPAPGEAVARLRSRGCAWWLDSAAGAASGARYSFVGADPYALLRVRGGRVTLEVRRDADPRLAPGLHELPGPVLPRLRTLLPPRPGAPAPPFPFAGGAVGYLGYEVAAEQDADLQRARATRREADPDALPDAVWLLVDRVLVYDHAQRTCVASALGLAPTPDAARAHADAAAAVWVHALAAPRPSQPPPRHRPAPPPAAIEPFDCAAYAKSVDAILHEIAEGNVYQACLTGRSSERCTADPLALHHALRRRNPAPFAAFLELPEATIASSSPERFLRVTREGVVESRPIKGTARRGADALQDEARRRALACSDKDRAENLMIVDLVRNDLGRVCEAGSVHVPELFAVEAHATVFQLVSTVRGRLAAGRDACDAIAACFPPGSMTGAPKIAAMRLLERLEPVRRGVYAGALGHLDAWGGADLSVVIRTLIATPGRAWLHAGGGIVADSRPDDEVREALDKLAPLRAALEDVARG